MSIIDHTGEDGLTFQEGLTVVGALRDYGSMRRAHGQDEDAVLVYAYTKIKEELTEEADLHKEEFDRAMQAVFVPNILNQETDDDS